MNVSGLLARPRSPRLTLVFLPDGRTLACERSPTSDLCPDVSGAAPQISGSDSAFVSLITHFGRSPAGGVGVEDLVRVP